jgi:cobalamin biosynthesis Mg chelatase CobN
MSFYGRPIPAGMENMGKAWKDEELIQLLKEVKSQMPHEEIAKAHKRTVGGIVSRLRSLASDYYLNDSKTINEIMVITGLPKDDIIDAINRREYRDELKAEKTKNKVKKTVSEEEILSKTLKPKQKESSELQEILILLKSIEARVCKYIQEKSIFDE